MAETNGQNVADTVIKGKDQDPLNEINDVKDHDLHNESDDENASQSQPDELSRTKSFSDSKGQFPCPVCGHRYKNEKGVKDHQRKPGQCEKFLAEKLAKEKHFNAQEQLEALMSVARGPNDETVVPHLLALVTEETAKFAKILSFNVFLANHAPSGFFCEVCEDELGSTNSLDDNELLQMFTSQLDNYNNDKQFSPSCAPEAFLRYKFWDPVLINLATALHFVYLPELSMHAVVPSLFPTSIPKCARNCDIVFAVPAPDPGAHFPAVLIEISKDPLTAIPGIDAAMSHKDFYKLLYMMVACLEARDLATPQSHSKILGILVGCMQMQMLSLRPVMTVDGRRSFALDIESGWYIDWTEKVPTDEEINLIASLIRMYSFTSNVADKSNKTAQKLPAQHVHFPVRLPPPSSIQDAN